MSDAIFVILGYGVILGGLAVYAVLLLRRLGAARTAAGTVARTALRANTRDDPQA